MITARKIKLTIISKNKDDAYDFIRKELQKQNKALNVAMNHLYFNYIAKEKIKLANESYLTKEKEYSEYLDRKYLDLKDAKTDKQKENIKKAIETTKKNLEVLRKSENKQATETFKGVIAAAEQTNLRDLISSQFTLTSDTKDRVTQIVSVDFKNDIAEILRGERTLRRYKKDNPLYIRGRALTFYKEDNEYFIKWMKGTIFKCILGIKKHNSLELQKTLDKVIAEEYNICDSSIEFSDNKLILNLTLDIPVEIINDKAPGRIVGVDLGIKIPAYCALNDVEYIIRGIGSIDDFLKVRTQMQSRRRSLQRALKSTRGGHGRDKKLKALNQFEEKENNFAKTYNHFLSSNIVKFAIDNKAEQINLEKLDKNSLSESVLKNWSYYQLQQFIKYKAERVGIKVKYVDPYLTSQACSKCGHFEEGQRTDQAHFVCKACGFEANADYNAARNIAMSTNYIDNKEESSYYQKENNEDII